MKRRILSLFIILSMIFSLFVWVPSATLAATKAPIANNEQSPTLEKMSITHSGGGVYKVALTPTTAEGAYEVSLQLFSQAFLDYFAGPVEDIQGEDIAGGTYIGEGATDPDTEEVFTNVTASDAIMKSSVTPGSESTFTLNLDIGRVFSDMEDMLGEEGLETTQIHLVYTDNRNTAARYATFTIDTDGNFILTYTMKFDKNCTDAESATDAPVNLEWTEGDEAYPNGAVLPKYEGNRTGYVFKGWSTKASPSSTDPVYPANDSTKPYNPSLDADENLEVKLYAVWKEKATVEYFAGEGSGTPPTVTAEYAVDDTVKLPGQGDLVAPEGKPNFAGWLYNGDNKVYAKDTEVQLTQATNTFTAQWEAKEVVAVDDIALTLPYDGEAVTAAELWDDSVTVGGVALDDPTKLTFTETLPKNAGTYVLSYTYVGEEKNYAGKINLTIRSITVGLTVDESTVIHKKYNKYADVEDADIKINLSGVLPVDAANVSVTADATYDNANAGKNKPVTYSNVQLVQPDGTANYVLPDGLSLTSTGEIEAIKLSISATISKGYDKTTTFSLADHVKDVVLTGMLEGESAPTITAITGATAPAFSAATVAGNKTIVNVDAVTLSDGNYYVAPADFMALSATIIAADQELSLADDTIQYYVGGDYTLGVESTADDDTNGAGTGPTYTYQSGNTSIAEINANTGKLTLKEAGSVTITVNASATDNYNAASKDFTLTINPKKTLTVEVVNDDALTIDYGEEFDLEDIELKFTFNDGQTTKPVSLSKDDYDIEWVTAPTMSGAGFIPVIDGGHKAEITLNATAATNEYQLKDEGEFVTLTVKPIKLTVTAVSKEMTYGDAAADIPALTLTYSGFVNGDDENTAGVFTTAPSASVTGISGAVTSTTPAGNYTITVTPGTAKNYTTTGMNGTFKIKQAPLTVKAVNKEMTYGETNIPELTLTYDGFKNGDTADTAGVFTTAPSATASVTSTTPVGEYPITVSTDGAAANYSITVENGTFEVTKATLTVTTEPAFREYGEANPTFMLKYEGFKNGETDAVLDTKPVASTLADKNSPVNSYTVTISGGQDNNYDFEYEDGTLTVRQADPQFTRTDTNGSTVTEESTLQLAYTVSGGATPTYEITEQVPEDGTSTVAAINPTTGLITAIKPGTIKVKISAEATTNYTAGYTEITITVNKKGALTVENFGDKNAVYGAAVPALDTPKFYQTENGATTEINLVLGTDYEIVWDKDPATTLSGAGKTKAGAYVATIQLLPAASEYALSAGDDAKATVTFAQKPITSADFSGVVFKDTTYNGQKDVEVTDDSPKPTLNGIEGSGANTDTVEFTVDYLRTDKNAGTAVTVLASIASISGSDADNYSFTPIQNAACADKVYVDTRTVKLINVKTALTKEWDGTQAAPKINNLTAAANLDAYISGDDLTITEGDSSYNSSAVADPAVISGNGFAFSLSGADSINYELEKSVDGAITAATLQDAETTATQLTLLASDADNTSLDALLAWAKSGNRLPATASAKNGNGANIANLPVTWEWASTNAAYNIKGATYTLVGKIAATGNYGAAETTTVSLVVEPVYPKAPAATAEKTIQKYVGSANENFEDINNMYSGTFPANGTTAVVKGDGTVVDGKTASYTIDWDESKEMDTTQENLTGEAFTGDVVYVTTGMDWLTVRTTDTVTYTIKVSEKPTATITADFPEFNYTGEPLTKAKLLEYVTITNEDGGEITPAESEVTFKFSTDGSSYSETYPENAATYYVQIAFESDDYIGSSNPVSLVIKKAAVTIEVSASKVYSGEKDLLKEQINGNSLTFTNADNSAIVAGDSITIDTIEAEYSKKDVHENEEAVIADVEYTGTGVGNYEIVLKIKGSIEARELEIDAVTITKAYDGNDVLEVIDVKDYTYKPADATTGIVGGENVSITGITGGKYDGATVSDSRTISGITAITLSSTNYKLAPAQLNQRPASITPANVDLAADSKTVSSSDISGGVKLSQLLKGTGLISPDTLGTYNAGFDAVLTFDNKGDDDASNNEWTVTVNGATFTVVFTSTSGAVLTANPSAGGAYSFTINMSAAVGASGNYTSDDVLTGATGTLTVTANNYRPSNRPDNSGNTGGTGGGATNYTVEFDAGENGTFAEGAVTSEKVASGKAPESAPTVIANDGYKFMGWSTDGETVIDLSEEKVKKNTTYIAVYAAYNFADGENHHHFMIGREEGLFVPQGNLTRAEAATMLARLSPGFTEDGAYTGTSFNDVAGHWSEKYIAFAEKEGIVSGYENEDGTYSFRPDAYVTRGEYSAMIVRFMNIAPVDGDAAFTDIAGHWAADSVAALADTGIVSGYEDGTFRANQTIVRSEATKIVNGAVGRTPDDSIDLEAAGYQNKFLDVSLSDWFYYHVMEATHDHVIADFH